MGEERLENRRWWNLRVCRGNTNKKRAAGSQSSSGTGVTQYWKNRVKGQRQKTERSFESLYTQQLRLQGHLTLFEERRRDIRNICLQGSQTLINTGTEDRGWKQGYEEKLSTKECHPPVPSPDRSTTPIARMLFPKHKTERPIPEKSIRGHLTLGLNHPPVPAYLALLRKGLWVVSSGWLICGNLSCCKRNGHHLKKDLQILLSVSAVSMLMGYASSRHLRTTRHLRQVCRPHMALQGPGLNHQCPPLIKTETTLVKQ